MKRSILVLALLVGLSTCAYASATTTIPHGWALRWIGTGGHHGDTGPYLLAVDV